MQNSSFNSQGIIASETRRIALITGLPLGGSTTFVLNFGRELVKRNIPLLVVCTEKEHPFAKDFYQAGIPVILTDERGLIYEDRIKFMLAVLKSFQPTVLIGCLGQISYEVLRYAPVGAHRVGVIQTDHAMFYDALAPYAPYLDAAVGVSRSIKEHLNGIKEFSSIQRHELPYGVPIPDTFNARPVSNNPLRLFYFGRLTNPQKRVYLLPQILKDLERSGIPFHWTIAGDGEEREFLEREMVTNGTDQQVTFLGSVTNSCIPELLAKQDIMILPSDAEGLPLSLLEAMGQGVVPVVTDLKSGLAEVVDHASGFLVPVDETEGYARAIIHLHHHREELASKSCAAQERVEKEFSAKAMTDRWLAVLPEKQEPMIKWDKVSRIHPPVGLEKSLRFLPLLRPLRRIIAKVR